jgi:D-3-phosphoglycerate dehydrogenase
MDGVMIINCARGGIIDENALYDALKSGKVAGAALDVFETEPPKESPLFEFDNLIGTPHLGASTKEAQTNVAVAVAEQIIAYLKHNTVINAVNVPSVTGELLEKLGPFLFVADRMGTMHAQLVSGPLEEVTIEYTGNFKGLDMAPVTTAAIKGLLTLIVKDDVNSVNAPILAKKMGITITETSSDESKEFNNLMTIKVKTSEMESIIAGTVYGKNDAKVVKINKFRLEIVPEGNLALIYNENKPGAIGSVGSTLGENNINISQMSVGREEDGTGNIIFLRTDEPLTTGVIEKLSDLPLVNSVIPLEL